MKTKNNALFTLLGLTLVTLGFALFDDEYILQYGFMGTGILLLLYSAVKGRKQTEDE